MPQTTIYGYTLRVVKGRLEHLGFSCIDADEPFGLRLLGEQVPNPNTEAGSVEFELATGKVCSWIIRNGLVPIIGDCPGVMLQSSIAPTVVLSVVRAASAVLTELGKRSDKPLFDLCAFVQHEVARKE